MNRALLLPSATLLDAIAGDPEWYPHPVRLIGLSIARGEELLRRPNDSDRFSFWSGALLSSTIVIATFTLARITLRLARRRSHLLGNAAELLLAWNCIASKNLYDEAKAVTRALHTHDISKAQLRLARIVGRDTLNLDACEISRAVVETIAESAADGILAPLFYLALGGVPLALAYKAVNTLDSMIGHADTQYSFFGKFAARLDDVANFIPARLTALAIIGSALITRADAASAFRIWRRDGTRHKSPNAGQPESALAGALNVRLGGSNCYAGDIVAAPVIGTEFCSPGVDQAEAAVSILCAVTLLGVATATLTLLALRTRKYGA